MLEEVIHWVPVVSLVTKLIDLIVMKSHFRGIPLPRNWRMRKMEAILSIRILISISFLLEDRLI